MKATFTKQNFNESAISKEDFIAKFNAEVLNENKMYADVFVFEGKATLQVRVSDHPSNLERICGGVSGNNISFEAFKSLIDNKVIK